MTPFSSFSGNIRTFTVKSYCSSGCAIHVRRLAVIAKLIDLVLHFAFQICTLRLSKYHFEMVHIKVPLLAVSRYNCLVCSGPLQIHVPCAFSRCVQLVEHSVYTGSELFDCHFQIAHHLQ